MKAHFLTLAFIAVLIITLVKFPLVFLALISLLGLSVLYMLVHSFIELNF